MLDNVASMFDDMKEMMKKLKKNNYETNMKTFIKSYGHFFEEMTETVDEAEDKEKTAKQIAVCFVDAVEERFASGNRKKISSHLQADLNLFAIFYIFPALLKTEHQDSRLIADSICAEWGARFKNSKISYTDYDSLYGTFREKIFGIF